MQERQSERASFFPVFSLQKRALIRITTILCNSQPLIGLITKCPFPKGISVSQCIKNGKFYKNVHAKADELISKVLVDGIYKDMILEMFLPVCHSIILWKFVHAPTIDCEFLHYFYWTDRGRINNKRTAKYILENERIPSEKRFMLACSLCLSEEVYEIWENMEDDNRLFLWTEPNAFCPLLVFWLKLLGPRVVFEEDLDGALDCALRVGSIEAIKYLFSILPEDVKNPKAMFCFNILIAKTGNFFLLDEKECDIKDFLFSQLIGDNKEIFDR